MTTPSIQSAEDQPPTPVTATIPADLLQAYVMLYRAVFSAMNPFRQEMLGEGVMWRGLDERGLQRIADAWMDIEDVHRAAGGGG